MFSYGCWCGWGSAFKTSPERRKKDDDTVDDLDRACKEHDYCYKNYQIYNPSRKDLLDKWECDNKLCKAAQKETTAYAAGVRRLFCYGRPAGKKGSKKFQVKTPTSTTGRRG